MSEIAKKAEEVRQRLVRQSRDPIDMGDYKQQIAVRDSVLNETLKLVKELAEKVEDGDEKTIPA